MKLTIKEIAIFGMLGALMCASKIAMEALPNIHLLGVFTIALTVVYRQKALYPIYVFVVLFGMFYGFPSWWIPHLYVWTVLWALTMLLPRHMPKRLCPIVYAALCGVHGLVYGVLYAPMQVLLYGLSWEALPTWIVVGLPYDILHGASNVVCGLLICPIIAVLKRAEAAASK